MSIKRPVAKNQGRASFSSMPRGIGQLTLVEHALCPLNSGSHSDQPLTHAASFQFPDTTGKRVSATATISAAFGLCPSDELLLWGLLGLTFAKAKPSVEFHASPHSILKALGCIDSLSDRGGSAYRAFRSSLRRLAGVKYQCDNFYDPIRREHRQVAFGLLSYSLPVDPLCSKAWRIVWDPLFFDFCGKSGGILTFDFAIYRSLDAASRRLYLFLSKILWRREWTHWLDVRWLATNVLGFSQSIANRNLKQKVKRAVVRLAEQGIISVPVDSSTEKLFVTRPNGTSAVRIRRGKGFAKSSAWSTSASLIAPEIANPMRAVGLNDKAIAWVAKQFHPAAIQQWAEITLAAKAKFGLEFFKNSPQAYFVDNLRKAAEGIRTPPDWWHDVKRAENQATVQPLVRHVARSIERPIVKTDQDILRYIKGDGRDVFKSLLIPIVEELCSKGKSPREAQRIATPLCVEHLKRRLVSGASSSSSSFTSSPF